MDESLKEWTINYIRHKDVVSGKLVEIDSDSKKDFLTVKFKDKTVKHYIVTKLDEKVMSLLNNPDYKVIVTFNNEENFNFLVKHWEKISVVKNLTVIFVNLKINDKWIINPYLHSMIADPESIETGLRTMFDTANGKIAEVKVGKKKPKLFDDDVADEDDSTEE
jgi:hypothetical protein